MYSILPVIALYDDSINKDVTRTEVHKSEGKHEAKRNGCALYDTTDSECKNFIKEVVDETWYKNIKDLDMLYTKVTSLKLLDHITKFCLGLHAVDAVDTPQLMKTVFVKANGILQYINAM